MDEIVRGEMGDEEPACEKILRSLAYISNVSNQVLTFHYVDCPEGQHIAINVFDKTDIGMDGNSGTMPQNIYKSGGDELERDLKESFKDSELEKEGFLSTEKTKKDRANNEHKDKRGKVQIVTKTQQVPYPSDNKVSYDKDKMSIDVEGDISERSKVGKQQKKHEYLQLFKVNQQSVSDSTDRKQELDPCNDKDAVKFDSLRVYDSGCHGEKMDQPKSLETGSFVMASNVEELSEKCKDQSIGCLKTEMKGVRSQISMDDNNWSGDSRAEVSMVTSGSGREPCESEDVSEAPESPESMEDKLAFDQPKFVEMPSYISSPYIVPSGPDFLLWAKKRMVFILIPCKKMELQGDLNELKCRIDELIKESDNFESKTVVDMEPDWEKDAKSEKEKTDAFPEKNTIKEENGMYFKEVNGSEPVDNYSLGEGPSHEEMLSNEVQTQNNIYFSSMTPNNGIEMSEMEDDSESTDFLEKDSIECLEDDIQIEDNPETAIGDVNADDSDCKIDIKSNENLVDKENGIIDEINNPTNYCSLAGTGNTVSNIVDVEDVHTFTDAAVMNMEKVKRGKVNNKPSARVILCKSSNMHEIPTKASVIMRRPGRDWVFQRKKTEKFGQTAVHFKQKSWKWKMKRSIYPATSKFYRLPRRPRHSGFSRGLVMLRGKARGRQCSGANNSGSGKGMPEQQAENTDSGSNSGGGKEGNENNNRNRNSNNNNNEDNDRNNGDSGENYRPTRQKEPLNLVKPPPNFKCNRKKEHGNISPDELQVLLGIIGQKCRDQGPVCDIGNPEVALCVKQSLHMLEYSTEDLPDCSICMVLHSLLKHFVSCENSTTCADASKNCPRCLQIFSLICSHVNECLKSMNGLSVTSAEGPDFEPVCMIRLCTRITQKLNRRDLASQVNIMWFHVRRILGRIIDGVALDTEDVVTETTFKTEVAPGPLVQKRPSRVSRGGLAPTLPSIPETQPLSTSTTGPPSNSRTLRRKPSSNLASVEEKGHGNDAGLPSDISSYVRAESEGEDEFDAMPTGSDQPVDGAMEAAPHSELVGQGQGSLEQGPLSGESSSSLGDYGKTGKGHASLPMGPPGYNPLYYPSIKEKPTGVKGIDEVVYGNKAQLAKVVKIFEDFKQRFIIEAKLSKHYREEGVILKEYKNKLQIEGIRYNINFQWEVITHLGNGMTGKCFLAKDFNTDFLFCVKEIHISKYEKEEIVLWSELEHPNIVLIYGSIRHGEKIYILQEFIDGGCLTEAINTQRHLGQRLSQRTALQLFKQLLDALVYLRTRNILHEDIKADNILLCKSNGNISIKMTDFGLARRLQGNRKYNRLVGTQTQWSPEKAQQIEYGFPAEVWAAGCVLVHILSGFPPWIKRFSDLKALMIVIVEKSPPVEDVPRNIDTSIKDIIHLTFTLCPAFRPTAEELLKHHAFQLLEDDSPDAVSMLDSFHLRNPPDNSIVDGGQPLLKEILESLEKKQSGKVQPPREQEKEMVKYPDVVNVIPNIIYERSYLSTENQGNPEPSLPDQNTNPRSHIERYYEDDLADLPKISMLGKSLVDSIAPLQLYQSPRESQTSQSSDSSLSKNSDEIIRMALLPKFGKIGLHDFNDTTMDVEVPDLSLSSVDSESEHLTDSVTDDDLARIQKSYISNVVPSQNSRASDAVTFEEFSSSSSSCSEVTDVQATIPDEITIEQNTIKIDPVIDSGRKTFDIINRSFSGPDDELFGSGNFKASTIPNSVTIPIVVPETCDSIIPGKYETSAFTPMDQTEEVLQRSTQAQNLTPLSTQAHNLTRLSTEVTVGGISNEHLQYHQNQALLQNNPKIITSVNSQPILFIPNQFNHSTTPKHPSSLAVSPGPVSMTLPYHQWMGPNTPSSYQRESQSCPSSFTEHGIASQHLQLTNRTMFIDSPTKGQSYVDYRAAQLKIFSEEKTKHHEILTNEELRRLNDAMRKIYYAWSSGTPLAQSMPSEAATNTTHSQFQPRQSPELHSQSPQRAHPNHPQLSPPDHRRLHGQYSQGSHGLGPAHIAYYPPHLGYLSTHMQGPNPRLLTPPRVQQSFQRGLTNIAPRGMPYQHAMAENLQRSNQNLHDVYPNSHVYSENTTYYHYANQGRYEHHNTTDLYSNNGHAIVHPNVVNSSMYGNSAHTIVRSGQSQTRQLSMSPSAQPSSNALRYQGIYLHEMAGIHELADPGRIATGPRPNLSRDPFIRSPSLNPRPPAPQQGIIKNPGLQVDIKKAVRASEGLIQSSMYHSQTAPVFSPPKGQDLQRGMSQPVIQHREGSHVSNVSQDELSLTGGSRSQYEEPDLFLKQYEKQISENSDPLHWFKNGMDNEDDMGNEEPELNSGDAQSDESIAPYLNNSHNDEAVTVKFVCGNMEQKYKFTKALKNKAWHELIKDELTWISKKFSLDQYCLRTENGDVLDIDLQPETSPLQLMVTRDGPWWADDMGLYFRSSPKPKSK